MSGLPLTILLVCLLLAAVVLILTGHGGWVIAAFILFCIFGGI